MTAKWVTLTQLPIGADIQKVVDTFTDIIEAIAAALKLITTALEVVKALAIGALNLLKEVVEAIIALIEELLFDLLEYNSAVAIHVNMNWNPYWHYDKEKERNKRTGHLDPRLVDWKADGQVPWNGTGLQGWLLDIAASAKDPSDPFRPVTDENTAVYGVMIIKGISNASDAAGDLKLSDWARLFTNWKGFSTNFDGIYDDPNFESISKMGTAAIIDAMTPFYQMGPKEQQFLTLQSALGDSFSSYASAFLPTPGNFPKWASMPMAALVPPLQTLFANLQRALSLISFDDDITDALEKLIQAITDKIETLKEAFQEVQDAINLLIAIAAFITDSYILIDDISAGGMDAFVADAAAAEDAPDFGASGIVVGLTIVSTTPDCSATVEKFMAILGVDAASYMDTATVGEDAVSASFEELFPP